MPEVGGKKYPYTKAGYKAAAAARKKLESDDSDDKKLEKVVKNPAPHKPKTDNAVPRSSNPQPTGTSIDGSSGSMGGKGGVKPRGPKQASIKSLQKFWQDDIDVWKSASAPSRLSKDHLPIPPRQGEVWDGVKHRWVRQENVGRTVTEVQGEKRFRGSGTGTQQKRISGKQPLTSRRYFARGTKGVVARSGAPSKRIARASRGPRARRKS
jgi:hypothetical protein